MCNLWSAYHCPLRADSARQEDHYWDYSTTNWWPGDYSASSTTDIDRPVERIAAGERKKEVELGSVLVCKHLFPRSIRLLIQRMILIQLPISLMKRIRLEIGIRIRYLGLMRMSYFGLLRVRNPLFRDKLDMLVRPRLLRMMPVQCMIHRILFILFSVRCSSANERNRWFQSSFIRFGCFWKSCFCEWLNWDYSKISHMEGNGIFEKRGWEPSKD